MCIRDRCYVISLSGGSVVAGPELAFVSDSVGQISMAALTSSTALLCYLDTIQASHTLCREMSVSGDTVTAGAATSVYSSPGCSNSNCLGLYTSVASYGASTGLVCYYVGDDNHVECQLLTVINGVVSSIGSTTVYASRSRGVAVTSHWVADGAALAILCWFSDHDTMCTRLEVGVTSTGVGSIHADDALVVRETSSGSYGMASAMFDDYSATVCYNSQDSSTIRGYCNYLMSTCASQESARVHQTHERSLARHTCS